MAFSPRYLIRMRPEVRVLPGPPPALTSGNAGQRVWSSLGEECAGSRTLTWLPLLVISQAVTSRPGCPPDRTSECEPSRVCVGAPTTLFSRLGQGLSYRSRACSAASSAMTSRLRQRNAASWISRSAGHPRARWDRVVRPTLVAAHGQGGSSAGDRGAAEGAKASSWAWCWAASGEGCRQTGSGPTYPPRRARSRRSLPEAALTG